MARFPLAIKIANVLVYFFLLGANIYSGLDPDNEDSPYDGNHVTFISPAAYTFGIWGLIHALLFGFVIYQWWGPEELILDGINWHFVFITLLNTLWLVLWQTDHLILAWIVILFTGAQITYVYKVIKKHYEDATISQVIWVHAPFSLYHAWIAVITAISFFAAFADDKTDEHNEPSVVVTIFVILALLSLASTATFAYIILGQGDIAGAIVIAWSLYGIAVEQDSAAIHWTALILGIITTLVLFIPIIKKLRGRGEERSPLLP